MGTLQFDCFRSLSDITCRSNILLTNNLPPGLRKNITAKFWFLAHTPVPYDDFIKDTPIIQKKTKARKQPRRLKSKNYEETVSSDTDDTDDDECFLNVKSRKLALMRKCKVPTQ